MWTCESILDTLKKHRGVIAHKMIVQATIKQILDVSEDAVTPPALTEMLQRFEQKEALVNGWLEVLPTEERFVVQIHLIDGLDWARTIVEHEKKWGVENGRSERTLKRIQAKAIQHIFECLETLNGAE